MFFSINGDRFHKGHPELAAFVLNKERYYLNPRYRFYVYFNIEGHLRSAGFAALATIVTGDAILLSEIAFPPFGYAMTIDSLPPDPRLSDISYFARVPSDYLAEVQRRPNVRFTWSPVVGDFPTAEEFEERVRNNRHAAD